MRNRKFKTWVKREIEREASLLESRTEEGRESGKQAGLEMPADSYGDLERRLTAEPDVGKKRASARPRFRPRLAVAAAAVLALAAGMGTSGAKLFTPEITEREQDGEMDVRIESGAEFYPEISEEEAYAEIEERLGILALRLGYKPKGMELETVQIGEEMGEASMEFYYGDSILRIYENKPNDSAAFGVQTDGKAVEEIELFFYDQKLEITEIESSGEKSLYRTQFERGNAYYCLSTDMDLDEFKQILYGIIFENV